MCYQLIDANRAIGIVKTLCDGLGVSVSGYYARRSPGIRQRQQNDVALLETIRVFQHSGRGLYGSDHIHKRLKVQGNPCSRKRIARLMRQHGLNSKRRQKRRKGLSDRGLLHHSDRGSQYTANHYLKHLADHGVLVSMSNKADPYDNAMIENFFFTFRAELTDLHEFATRDEARVDLFDFIEVFYNRQHIHSSIDYLSPVEYEACFSP